MRSSKPDTFVKGREGCMILWGFGERKMVCMQYDAVSLLIFDWTVCMYSVSYLLLCEMAYMIGEGECRHGRKGMINGQVHY